MTLSLNVLNHLGINLYSNVPAVLSEVVANAWDADAEVVRITIDKATKTISITDDGHGMNRADINDKFLMVGYRRRDAEGGSTTPKFKRAVMGRKGIGKLSLFSIANEIRVFSLKDGQRSGFSMKVADIKRTISRGEATYHPEELQAVPKDLKKGTRILLTGLKKTIGQTEKALRKRLARRFSVVGESQHFSIQINGKSISIVDRDYFHKLQFLWTYGEGGQSYLSHCKNLENKEERPNEVHKKSGYLVAGWIGTVRESGDLKDESDNLNKILIMVRGKVAQEDILEGFNEGGMYSKYLIGEIHADFLDLDTKEDIATSSRQKIIEDDPRYELLTKFLWRELKHIQNKWTDLRNKEGEKRALELPAVKEWFTSLSTENKQRARSLFGKINQLTLDSDDDRKRLLKHAVLAFESLRYRENLDALDQVTPENLGAFAAIFEDLDDIEATLYHQIVSERIQVIDALQEKVESSELEKIIQKHLFDHLWLLDPSWERTTGTEYMEQTVDKEFEKIDAGLTPDERKGRLDIKYRITSGKHLIIELKRADRVVSSFELMEQVNKYRSGLRKLLNRTGKGQEPMEVVVVVGRELSDWVEEGGRDESARAMAQIGTRVVMYQELLENAHKAYRAYIDKRKEAGRILKVIQSIDASEMF
jgi:hypothetical protein